MEYRIETLPEKKLVGQRMLMSLSENKTVDLWKSFMPRRNEIKNKVGDELFSMQIYDPLYFRKFSPDREFEKWAAIEVTDYETIPEGMKKVILPGGLYVVFLYKGTASEAGPVYQYIFSEWIPNSRYDLDTRPHFEILGRKYKNNDPDSEEEIWIPIKNSAK